MADAVERFFEGLAGRGHEPALAHASGTIRFEIVDGKRAHRVLVSVHRGNVTVSRRADAADCVVRMDRPLLERIVRGQQNATAALLRGAVQVEGDVSLLVLFQKLLPGPSGSRRRGTAKAKAREK
jgi:putative sterol carrier protein